MKELLLLAKERHRIPEGHAVGSPEAVHQAGQPSFSWEPLVPSDALCLSLSRNNHQ